MTKIGGVALDHSTGTAACDASCAAIITTTSSSSAYWSIIRITVVPTDASVAASALEAVVQHPSRRVVAVGPTATADTRAGLRSAKDAHQFVILKVIGREGG